MVIDSKIGEKRRVGGWDRTGAILAVAILAYTLTFSWIAYTKFRSFASQVPQDMAAHSQAIWNTSHGRFLQQTVLYIGGLNHFYPLLALFAPICRLANPIPVLLFLYTLILACGAVPVYLLAKDQLGSRHWGLLLGLFYLGYPGLHYLNLWDLKPIVLSVPLFLFSFYFWQAKDLRGFLIAALLTTLVTEQVAILIAMFAPLSWIKKRDRSWILPPLLIGVAILLISMYLYVPLASGAPYKHIRDHSFFSHLHLLSWDSYRRVFSFLGLAAVFLFASWEAFLPAIPYLFFGIFATRIYAHYYIPLTAVLFIALIYGLKRIKGEKALKGLAASSGRTMLVVVLILLDFFVLDPFLIKPRYDYPMSPSDQDAWALIQRIPRGASVTADPRLLPALSLREKLHEFSRKEYHGEKIDYLNVDYILIDPRGPHRDNRFHHEDYPGNARRLMEETLRDRSGFEVLSAQGDWVLFHRKGRP
jgi:uncharacterized membrane protein